MLARIQLDLQEFTLTLYHVGYRNKLTSANV